MDVLAVYVRRVELAGRLLQHGQHPASLLHQRGPLLRHRQASQVPHQHDQARGGHHADQHLASPGSHLLPAHLLRLVHHQRPQAGAQRVRL